MTIQDWHDTALGKFQPTADEMELDSLVNELINSSFSKPSGSKNPKSIERTSVTYERDPKVKAWVLQRANGCCENCGHDAPFKNADGKPYLEVHHIEPLSQGGADTTSNTVALCPNCHRALHFSVEKLSMIKKIKKKVARLK
jgi:5-methylcytosine-specific restriction protein A